MSAAEPPHIVQPFRRALAAGVLGLVAACQSLPPGGEAAVPSSAAAPAPAATATDRSSGAQASIAAEPGPLGPLAWLEGCWHGMVNQREFREQWMPLRGAMLIGAGQQASGGRMQDYEFLRMEARPDGVYFAQFSGDRKETSFRLASTTTDEKDTIFTFANTTTEFPARLVYRRGADGWLYETIEGALNGADKKVIYPMRRIDCESGELITR
jgi:hypothetical protein